MKNITWKEHKKELLKDKAFKEELKKIEPEFDLARQIIQNRLKIGLTQSDLAKKASTNQVVISRLENAGANPSLELMERVASALGKKIKITLAKK
ncbi:transcriptional regulator [bacterium (Candidatus Howlettbacteria) CG_4_10_14_0_8_um_filter_40_9]|nr:MAG: transcriptional regulator [bacterium (Candidatus Howlettbacteria) CG_4_10_14_0_8_um_filter_40_9]